MPARCISSPVASVLPRSPYLAQRLHQLGVTARLLYGARSINDLVAQDLVAAHGVTIDTATDDGSSGHHGFVTEILDQHLAALPEDQRRQALAYVCGPTPMMAATEAVLTRHGAGGHFSVESTMACGFGVCLSCVMPIRCDAESDDTLTRICVDGPTFPAGRVNWARSIEP